MFGPIDALAGRLVDDVGDEQRKLGLARARLEGTAAILAGLRGDVGADRPVVELVVADRRRGVAERVVRANDVGAFGEVRLERALKQIAGVDEHHATAVGRARRANVRDEPAEQRQPLERAVQIVRADDRDHVRVTGAGGAAGVLHGRQAPPAVRTNTRPRR